MPQRKGTLRKPLECTKCGTPRLQYTHSHKRYCKVCSNKRTIEWRKKNPYAFQRWLYGITPDQYATLRSAQANACAICKRSDIVTGTLCVDHNHSTGTIRGLLCRQCNVVLGLVRDKPGTLQNAITYLAGTA